MYTPREVLWYYREQGIGPTISRAGHELAILVLASLYGLLDQVTDTTETSVCVYPQEATLDQDTLALITQAASTDLHLSIAVDSPSTTRREHSEILSQLDAESYDLVKGHSLEFVRALANSRVVIFKDRLWQYRLVGATDTAYIRIPHGLPAKAPKVPSDSSCGISDLITGRLRRLDNYTYTVASELEYHREIGVMDRHEDAVSLYGYPRFDRLRHLAEHPDDTLISSDAREKLAERTYNILYAPTHKDNIYETELFPFPDKDPAELRDFLDEYDMRLFLRLHVREEDTGLYDEYVDGETICYAGHRFSGSGIELLPHIDALVTDYSSIFLEYVLIDRPILYVHDNRESFEQLRGYTFDYNQYWPGPTLETQTEFCESLTLSLLSDSDEFGDQRQFVQNTFHPPKSEGFLQNVGTGVEAEWSFSSE